MSGYTAFGMLPFGMLPEALDHSSPDPLWRLLQEIDPQLRYLVEFYPWDSGIRVNMLAAPSPVGMTAFGVLHWSKLGSEGGIYLADHHFIGEPDDVVPDQYFSPVIDNALQYDVSLIRGSDIGVNTPTFGAIEIANGDGELDHLSEMSWRGRRVLVKAGTEGMRYADYAVVLDGLCNSIEFDDRSITITISDKGLLLDKHVMTPEFAGTGGLEGGDDLVGRMKPMIFGHCYNIEPVLVDAVNLIYQAHASSMQAIDVVYDSGVALAFDADYPDILTAAPAVGEFATCLATGHIKLGSTPFGRITADARGDNSGGYVSHVGDVCVRMATTVYDRESFHIDALDPSAWATLNADMPGDVGIFILERRTLRQLFDELLNPCAAYWYFDRDGKLAAACIDTVGIPSSSVDASRIDVSGFEMIDAVPPSWRISVGYAPAWTVQGEDELAGATTEARRTFVGNERRLVTYENRLVRSAHLQPMERVFYTNLADKASADALLERLVRIYGQERKIYRGATYQGMFQAFIGDVLTINYPRYGINRPMTVLGISEDTETATTSLELWG